VGIIVGASIVNQAIVDGLNHRIDTVGKNADRQRAANQKLTTSVKQLESYLTSAAPYVVENRLTAVPVVVVAEQGVDRDTVRNVVTLLQDAGAQSPAIVWISQKWLLDKPADRSRLAAIVNDQASSAVLRKDALAALAHRLGTAAAVSTGTKSATATTTPTTTASSGAPDDLLSALSSAGFLSIEAVGASGTTDLSTFPLPGVRAVIVGGVTSDLKTTPVVTQLATAFSAISVPTVAGDVYRVADGQAPRGTDLGPIRNNAGLAKSISTVDDVDLVQGDVAVVLATAESGESKIGHFGYGNGADRALPSWPGP
jgi:hypothetical protein